jgi:hypothetical protein
MRDDFFRVIVKTLLQSIISHHRPQEQRRNQPTTVPQGGRICQQGCIIRRHWFGQPMLPFYETDIVFNIKSDCGSLAIALSAASDGERQ